ncbi:hypothetical protein LK994_14060 [Ferruginibacter lapsinanis]|uniref:hypothetical protein n=1 Tax=Ferruginibacter lapsinanis TaxID=563172 RepID=UPI001E5F53C5|nr:hypothetical protein [Ferruginibacter lapsinanis]UEG49761.1 hypothetical protein LK994_14060 [Ferruginibacter lapsinanis]
MEFFIEPFKVIDTHEDAKGNIYHLAIIKSLWLSIVCEMGIKEAVHGDKYYVNYISIRPNSDLKKELCHEGYSFEPFSLSFIQSNAKQLLSNFILDTAKSKNINILGDEADKMSGTLIDEIFGTSQAKIDDKINMFL